MMEKIHRIVALIDTKGTLLNPRDIKICLACMMSEIMYTSKTLEQDNVYRHNKYLYSDFS